jgi:transposase
MSDNQSSISSEEPQWAAFAAIDWGDKKHFWALQMPGDEKLEQGQLENTPEALETWATGLRQRFSGRPVAIALEQKRGTVVYMLIKYAHLVLYPVPPAMSASYRKAFFPSGAKGDPGDTRLLLDLLVCHRERLRPWQPDTQETRLLQLLVENRRQLVDEKTRHVLRLTDCVKQYFPQLRLWFDDLDTPLVGALLERWPDLQHLRKAHPGTLRKFFHEQNCRKEDLIQQRIDAIYAATPATNDTAILEACTRKALSLVKLLNTLRSNIAAFDLRLHELVSDHPDGPLFASFPGAGAATVPRLIAAFGTNRDHYQNAYEIQCLSGIAPVQEASGQNQWIHFRWACPKFLRQTFHEFAAQSILQCEWAKAFYQQQRDKHKSHHAAVRALAYKWIRILFRCWKDRRPYDEQKYLQSVRRRSSLVGPALAGATAIGWNSVAGFKKLSENPS